MLSLKANRERREQLKKENLETRRNMFNWEKLESAFYKKYPSGKIWKHGEMECCDVAVRFAESGKVYNYTGTYDMVADKLKLTHL